MKKVLNIFVFLLLLITLGCTSSPRKTLQSDTASPIKKIVPTQKNVIASNGLVNVLFVPGMGFGVEALTASGECLDKNYMEWKEFNGLFREKGFNLQIACIPAVSTINELAKALEASVKIKYPPSEKKRFHIIAKSMGGLAVRKLLSDQWKSGNSLSDQVITVTTLSTPHKGTYIANMLAQGEFCTGTENFLSGVVNFIARNNRINTKLPYELSIEDLTTYAMQKFNDKVKDDPAFLNRTFSYGAVINCDSECRSNYRDRTDFPNFIQMCWHDAIVKNLELNFGPESNAKNDGLVTVDSASYFGEYIETFEGDHMALSERDFLYKGEPIWRNVFSRILDKINEYEAIHKKGELK